MNILAIESSCDETAAAIIRDGREILSNVVVSQIDIFKAYGGVIPEVAARSHLEAMLPVVHQAFEDAGFQKDGEDDWDKIDAIAVTHTPGLLGSLLIGTLTARTLAILHNKPLYPVHHLKSHIYASWLSDGDDLPEFPLLALVVSGGHTQIIHMKKHNDFEIIGTTRDDAVGECFDKVAKILGLPYPGGPSIAAAAKNGDPLKYRLPHPQIEGLDFSFSGLKTAVLRAVQKELGKPISFPSHQLAPLLNEQQVADFAASFQQTAIEILLEKLATATRDYPAKSLVIAGGVSANNLLREETLMAFSEEYKRSAAREKSEKDFSRRVTLEEKAVKVHFPDIKLTGDNAAMVGAAAFYEIESGVQPTDPYKLNILPRSDIY